MTGIDDQAIGFAAGAIRDAEEVVALTGAGVSTASGIPDFRSDDGLWQDHDPMDFHIDRFEADPEGFWRDRMTIVEELYGENVEPNAAHVALAELEDAGQLDAIITQNIDGLHQVAGSEEVVEIHGNGQRVVCRDCSQRGPLEPVQERIRSGDVPPRCEDCNGLLKPDTVLFGERLPKHALYRSHALAETADAFLVVGSSLTVEPAASLPRTAAETGATLVVTNLDKTPLSDRAEYDFRSDVTHVLPRLREEICAVT